MNTPAYEYLLEEHRALLAHYGRAQTRCTDLLLAQGREIERLQGQAIRLRARAIAHESALAWEREDRAAVMADLPGLPRRRALVRQVEGLVSRIHDLAREALHWQWRASAGAAAGTAPSPSMPREIPRGMSHAVPPMQPHGAQQAWPSGDGLQRAEPSAQPMRSVLCIGQDASGALVTQRMVESAEGLVAAQTAADALLVAAEDGDAALEASLIAADLVICQTGCVGHNAYWRVQDHCRRTGKPCVLVDQPQVIHFMRGAQAPRAEPVAHTAA
ncbi:MAG: DUF2325 domain-containing protein [Comamonadaceae bacterium]|nr:MAG: DUF2325 domain-containing protein [Comamonadaceae bacterium]